MTTRSIGRMLAAGMLALLPGTLAAQQVYAGAAPGEGAPLRAPEAFPSTPAPVLGGASLLVEAAVSPAEGGVARADSSAARKKRSRRSLAVVGAGVGALGMGIAVLGKTGECMDPIGCFIAPSLFGAVVGGAVGGLMDLVLSAPGRPEREERPRRRSIRERNQW